MADINIGSDQLLTTTLNDNDRLTFTRAETGQQIATITLADFLCLINIDATSLTERPIPGEFWTGRNGSTRKQVYVKTLIGTTPQTSNDIFLMEPYLDCEDVALLGNSHIEGSKQGGLCTYNVPALSAKVYWTYNCANGFLRILCIPSEFVLFNSLYVFTVKYTKR